MESVTASSPPFPVDHQPARARSTRRAWACTTPEAHAAGPLLLCGPKPACANVGASPARAAMRPVARGSRWEHLPIRQACTLVLTFTDTFCHIGCQSIRDPQEQSWLSA